MASFRYLSNLDVILDEETGYHLTRKATERLLDRWQAHHDELLRSGTAEGRLTARKVRSAWIDLDLAVPPDWIEAKALERGTIQPLRPITLRVVTPREGWVATPERGEVA